MLIYQDASYFITQNFFQKVFYVIIQRYDIIACEENVFLSKMRSGMICLSV